MAFSQVLTAGGGIADRAGCAFRVIALISVTFAAAQSHAQSADDIVKKMRDTYGALNSYADSAVMVREYGATDRHTFATCFKRTPRHFLLDFHKEGGDRYAVWGDPDGFHTWWKTTKQTTDYPNPSNTPAITLSGPPTESAVVKIPTLLYPNADLGGDFTNFAAAKVEGNDDIRGHRCYRLTGKASDSYAASGKEVNIRKMTLWIDAESFLLRQVREEWPPVGGTSTRLTTTYEPQSNPSLDEAKFKFSPPAP
jgi:outer membrane lipoprotein-sorting protein